MQRIWRALLVLALFASVVVATPVLAVSANPTPDCSAGTSCTILFNYTGDFYQWNAPVSETFTLEVWGAQGGTAENSTPNLTAGGKGGYAKGNISVTSGQTLYIYVGGQGASSGTSLSNQLSGGYNGGAVGYNGDNINYRGSGGGGGTDIRTGGSALANRVIVAGGGAGGAYYTGYGTNYPGAGGGSSGVNGYTSGLDVTQPHHGKGGTQSAGGTGGANGGQAGSGTLGNGGAGVSHSYGSAGAGGGYYGGGGGGAGMGAGGGSGYVGGVTTTTLTAGNASMPNPSGGTMTGRTGNGFVRITYPYTIPSLSLSIAGNVKNANKGVGIVLTAAINVSGNVTFYADKKRIAGCISLSATSGNKTCTWKPTGVRTQDVYAVLTQAGTVVATSSIISIAGTKRTSLR